MKKKLPIGISDFKKVIDGNYYYFDKTELIKSIIGEPGEVKLFTRPRRFGKTLNMSMIKYFFDIENKDKNKKLFENLKISENEYFEKQGTAPVISISFRNYDESNWENGFEMIKNTISDLYDEFEFVKENLSARKKEKYDSILFNRATEATWKLSLLDLTKYLYEYYGQKVVVLIDEYDQPIIDSYVKGYYQEAISFFKTFYGVVLKDNNYLEMGIMTGILRVAKENIFSGLNNLRVHTILDNRFTEYFGITENEVEKALKDFNLEFELQDVQKWYNGYLFGDINVYNPWSIINFLKYRDLKAHWVNTSSNDEIMNYLENSDEKIIFELEELLSHKSIRKEIYDFVTFQDIDYALNLNKNNYGFEVRENGRNYEIERDYFMNDFGHANIWQFFLHSGYLTVEKKLGRNVYDLKIPNEELFDFFRIRFLYRTYRGHYRFYGLGERLINGNYEKFRLEIRELLKNAISFRDLKEENSYHLFVIGLVSIMSENYLVKSNMESGDGIPDLVLKPKDKNKKAFIFEFKYSRAKDSKNLKRTAKSALKQINDRNYFEGLKYEGYKEIVKIGMGFRKKDVEVVVEEE